MMQACRHAVAYCMYVQHVACCTGGDGGLAGSHSRALPRILSVTRLQTGTMAQPSPAPSLMSCGLAIDSLSGSGMRSVVHASLSA